MGEFNKSYRIRTDINKDTQVHVKLDRDYDMLEIMSLKIGQINDYKLHTCNYGVVAGRVLANDAFGIPNAKVSVFIQRDANDIQDAVKNVLYPYNSTHDQDKNGTRYNLLPNEQLNDCHTIIGTFPEKQYILDNDNILDVFETYYKFTTRTNNAGDYMIFGIPTGNHIIHVDIDLSDIGILSQKPRDMFYKGYNVESFETPNKFKYDTNLDSLVQVISQDSPTNVIPFWSDNEGDTVGITRCDINIQYKFEPTCVFMGSVVSDTSSNGISKKCIPTPSMGAMDEIVTGSGTIEMIRKTPSGSVEELRIKGNQLINGNGVWCYQIPMNLDYMMTDEFGNMVPTNHPEKGIPTRTQVRFRLSLQEFDNNTTNFMLSKVLIPHNPSIYGTATQCSNEIDYNFGTNTQDNSYRDLFWNGVYSVKSYIPRIQKGDNWKHGKFTGFKRVNYYGDKNPIPYNNIRIKIPFAFTIMCIIIKSIIRLTGFLNRLFRLVGASFVSQKDEDGEKKSGAFLTIPGEMCNDNLDFLCIIPGVDVKKIAGRSNKARLTLLGNALIYHYEELGGNLKFLENYVDDSASMNDSQSVDYENSDSNPAQDSANGVYGSYEELKVETSDDGKKSDRVFNTTMHGIRVTDKTDYLIQCIEMNLAQEYKVIQFDFYNDWLNGVIYIPRWMRTVSKKRTFNFFGKKLTFGGKIKACNNNKPRKKINLVQQCALSYRNNTNNMEVSNSIGCKSGSKLRCHKAKEVRKKYRIFKESGLIHGTETSRKENVYYLKPVDNNGDKNVRLFATDIILLGTLNSCDRWGIPGDLNDLSSSTYQMPTNLALTDSDLEGNDYESKIGEKNYIYLEIVGSKAKVRKLVLNDCYSGINPFDEDGNYTELSGISWGYEGPLQTIDVSGVSRTKLYKPGGHFLGISCTNSETNIKSCVNLSRICEHGVWMSQRQELNIPNPSATNANNAFLNYATVPSGFVSKDEISDTNYRRIFASLNKNRLKTKVNPETGYPIYDFEYVNPTNFNGELNSFMMSTSGNDGKYMNRKVAELKEEHSYEYLDDDNYKRSEIETWPITPETQIMRTGEFSDNEYFKYRFGFVDSDFSNGAIKKNSRNKRFLLTDSNNISFPVYDNSFYFYFGLQPGNTALDEFKKTYYASCEKNDLFSQSASNISVIGLTTEYDGLSTTNGSGSLSYDKIIANNDVLTNGLNIQLTSVNNEVIDSIENDTTGDAHTFNNLKEGEYKLIISSSDGLISKELSVTIGRIRFSATLTPVSFNKDVSNKSEKEKFRDYDNREDLGGYLIIPNNTMTYYKSEYETEDINIFTSSMICKYIIKSTINNFTIEGKQTSVTFNGITKTLVEDSNGNYMIPVPKESESYTLEIYTYIGLNSKPIENIGTVGAFQKVIQTTPVTINNGLAFDFLFNGIPFKTGLFPYISNLNTQKASDTSGWWDKEVTIDNKTRIEWDSEDRASAWKIKNALYMNTVNQKDKCHSITISSYGGTSPHTTTLKYYDEGNLSKEETKTDNLSPLSEITIPTLNYRKNNVRRNNFSYRVTDKIGQNAPAAGYFMFPIIYKPFFMEMILCNYEESGIYLCGNIYNGKTWTESEGFNNCLLNSQKMQNITTTLPDTTMVLDEIISDGTKVTGGGLSYTGDLFKYNGRKITVTRNIQSLDIFNIDTNGNNMICDLNIGTSHIENGIAYTDSTYVLQNPMTLYKFIVDQGQKNGEYRFRMDVNPNSTVPCKIYALIDENSGEKGCYPYPFNKVNGIPTIHNTKLFRHIMDGNLTDLFGKNGDDDEPDYISINSQQISNKKVYYIAIPKISDVSTIEKSVDDNIFKSISISRLIDVARLNNFYPLELKTKKDACIDTVNDDGTYNSTITLVGETSDSVANIYGKRFTLKFYADKKGENLLLTVTKTPNTNKEIVFKPTSDEREKLGLHSVAETSTISLYYDYEVEIISDGTKSPSSYGIRECKIAVTRN